ncbi:MAG: histone deacetylase family protein [Bacteroidales bacterium]|nr:histone deacetylase family protein [Bacteroidales bacterium]
MLRIRKILNPNLESNLLQVAKVKDIIKKQFPDLSDKKIEAVEQQMVDPVNYKYQTTLFVALDISENVIGFAILLYMSDLKFCFLDYIASSPTKSSSGVGSALYDRIREEALALKAFGVFFECLPDDPALCRNTEFISQNQKRLAFYEKFGARPIANTLYETNVYPTDDCPPYLVFDGLGINQTIPRNLAKKIIKAILTRKYADYCPTEYIDKVINSIKDNPVILRNPIYSKSTKKTTITPTHNHKILLVINDKHNIHHIKEKGYVESPVRISSIKKELDKTGLFEPIQVKHYPDKLILDVHDKGYFTYFKKVCENLPKGKSVYPYVFPLRNVAKAPKELSVRAGYYCFDTFTPLNQNAFLAARNGVDCALTAADKILEGKNIAYVLTRPPGHHVEKAMFGGFSYFNNCAIVANYLSKVGNVAILDIDFHHGNGQQQIFYERNDVLTISIHGHPSFAYPYFSGFSDEKGINKGLEYNHNFPLPENASYDTYKKSLKKALSLIKNFKPSFLVIALGLDTAKGDPTGTWSFTFENFNNTGKIIGELKLPTIIIQEGGYKNQSLGINAKAFFTGFHSKFNY